MSKLFKWLSIAVLTLGLSLTMGCPQFAEATVKELAPGKIVVSDSVYASDFFEFYVATEHKGVKHYHIMIHSPGGSPWATIGIINRILELKAKGVRFTTETYSTASSAGSYIFMMGDERIMHKGSVLMWHTMEAQGGHRYKEWQKRCDNFIRKMFKRITGFSDKLVHAWLDSGKAQWMSCETAYNVGIATKIISN